MANSDEFLISLQADVDLAEVKKKIESLNNKEIKLKLDSTLLDTKSLVSDIEKTKQQINKSFSNIGNIDSAKNFANNFTYKLKDIEKDTSDLTNRLKQQFSNLQSVSWTTDQNKNLDSFTAKLELAENKIESLKFVWQENEGQYTFSGSSGIDNFTKTLENQRLQVEKNSNSISQYRSKLDTIQSRILDSNSGKAIVDEEHLNLIGEKFITVEKSINSLKGADKTTSDQIKTNIQNQIQEIEGLISKYHNLESQMVKNSASVTKYKSDLDTIQSRILNPNENRPISDTTHLSELSKQYDIVVSEINKLENADKQTAGTIKANIDSEIAKLEKLESEYRKAESVATSFKPQEFTSAKETAQLNLKTFISDIEKSNVEFKNMQGTVDNLWNLLNNAGTPAQLSVFRDAFTTAKSELKSLKAESANILNTERIQQQTATLISQINTYKRNNTKALDEFGGRIDNIIVKLKQCNNGGQLTSLRREWGQVRAEIDAAGLSGKTFLQTVIEKVNKFTGWFSISQFIMKAFQGAEQLIDNVIEIDTAMTNLKKVTDETDDSYSRFLADASLNAKELGASIKDVVDATSEFARLGYNLEDSSILGKTAILYKNVGDGITAEQASKSIISTMKAYNLQAKDAEDIVSKFNKVGNEFAISSAGIGDALQRSASALNEANNSLSESIALQVGANNVMQDPDAVGNMWKTVSMRIRGAKTELEDAGEDTKGLIETTSELQKLVKDLTGFDILQADQQSFKSTYDIVVGIGKEWKNLSDIKQASLLEALAGKKQGNALAAALNNIQDMEKAYQAAENSAGSAREEQEKYTKSIQYSLDSMKATAEEFSINFVDSDEVKFVVDSANTILGIISKIADVTGGFPTLIGGITAALSVANKGIFRYDKDSKFSSVFGKAEVFDLSNITQSRAELERTFKIIGNLQNSNLSNTSKVSMFNRFIGSENISNGTRDLIKDFDILSGSIDELSNEGLANLYASQIKTTKGFSGINSVIKTFNSEQIQGGKQSQQFAQAVGQTNVNLGKYLSGLNGAKASFAGYSVQLVGAKLKTIGLKAATTALNMALTMGVSTAISFLISTVSDWIVTSEEAADAAEDLKNSYEKAIGTINDNLKTVKDLSDEFNSLSKGVGKHGENVSLTADEYSRYKEIVEQLVGINPDLVEGYDKENKAIINKNGAIERTIELLKTQQKLENEKYTTDDSIETDVKGLEDRFEKIKDKFDEGVRIEDSDGRWIVSGDLKELKDFLREKWEFQVGESYLKQLNKYFNKDSIEFLQNISDFSDTYKSELEKAFQNKDIEEYQYNYINTLFDNSISAIHDKYVPLLDDLDNLSKSANSTLAIVVQTADGYDKLTESQKGFVNQLSQDFRIDFASNVDTFTEGMDDHVQEVQDEAEKLRTLVTAMSTDIELAVQFDIVTNIDENATVDEMTKIIQGVINKIKNNPELKKYGVKKSELEEWFGLAHINEIEKNLKERLSSVFKDVNDKDLDNKLGKLTEVQLDNLYNVMSSADLSGFVSMDKAIDHFLKTVENTRSLDDLTKSLDEFKDKGFDRVAKDAEIFNSALQKLGENKTLSGEDVRKLIDLNADLADSFTATKDGFVIDSQKLVNAKQKYLQTTIDSINEEISANKLVAQSSKKSAEEQKQYIDMLNNQLSQVQRNNPTKAKELSEQLEVATQRYEEFNEEGKKANEQAEILTTFLQIILQYLGIASDVATQTTKNYDLVNDYLKSQQENINKVVKGLEDEKKTQQGILDKLKEQKEELEKQKQTVEEIIADYKTAGSVVNKFIDERIESLNKQKTALEEEYEDETKRIEDRYDKELSALKSKNDEINKSIELKKAEDALYNAKNTQVRYYTGGGWNRGTNATEIAEKQQSLNALRRESRISALEKERDNALKGIENRKDNDSRLKNYESEIEQYEKYKEAFANMVDSYENEQNNLTAQRILGVGWHEKVLNKDSGLIADYGRRYNRYQHQLNIDITNAIKDKDREIEAQQKVIDAKQIEIDGWNEYSTELADYVEQISLSNESYIKNLQGVEVDEKNVLDNRIHNLQEFKQNASKLLDINVGGEEINGDSNGGNGYKSDSISMGGYHGSTNTEQTKKGSSYQMYFVNSDGNDEQLGMAGSLESMMKAKQTWIDKFVKYRNSSTDDELEKRFGYHGAKNAPNDGIRQFLNTKLRIRAFASGGTADFTDFIKIDGTPQKSETIFNSGQSKKLYDLVNDTTDLSKLIADRVSPSINRIIDSLAMNNTSMPQTIHNEFVFTGDIRAENYSEFEKCMNTYLQKVQMNIFTGR